MYQVHLSDAQGQELRERTRAPSVKPRTRDRLEMVRLSDAGLSIPGIARHLQISEARVRFWIKRFLTDGFDALPDQPHPGQRSSLTPQIAQALRLELARGDRTWTGPQIATWLMEHHRLSLRSSWLSVLLRRAGLSYKRTQRQLKHQQDPARTAQGKAELRALEKGE